MEMWRTYIKLPTSFLISFIVFKIVRVQTTNSVHENDLLVVLDPVQMPRNTSLLVPDECMILWALRPGAPVGGA